MLMKIMLFVAMASKYIPKYFTEHEFQKVHCCVDDLDPESLKKLDACRRKAGIPFILTSAYRSRQSEIEKGRSGNSAHTRGRAFDISCTSDRNRALIISAALAVGFTRIGIAKNFIHLDDDIYCLPSPRIWVY